MEKKVVEIAKNYGDGCGHNDGVNKTEKDEARSKSQHWDGNRNTKGSSYIWCNSFQNPEESFCRSIDHGV